jgi:hypothetical protein
MLNGHGRESSRRGRVIAGEKAQKAVMEYYGKYFKPENLSTPASFQPESEIAFGPSRSC